MARSASVEGSNILRALEDFFRLVVAFAIAGAASVASAFGFRLTILSHELAGTAMPTKAQIEAQNLYANLLEEINLRIAAINHCTAGRSGLAPPFVKDFCYLQLRMLCELVALGCLVAHGDIKQTSSNAIQKQWSADKIMDTLEKLHPHFYPIAIKQTKTGTSHHLQAINPSPLPKADFLDLYHRCGGMLHRGNLRTLLKGQFPTQISYPEITAKAQRLVDLMANHALVMRSGEQMFLAMLLNTDTGKVQVAIAETPRGQPMQFASPTFLKDPPKGK